MAANIYVSGVPTGPGLPGPVPQISPSTGIAGAIGTALLQTAESLSVIARANETTRANKATTEYITRLDALNQQFQEDPDYETAPERFMAAQRQLEDEILKGARVSPQMQAEMQLQFRRAGLGAQANVDGTSRSRTVDANNASLVTLENQYLTQTLKAAPGSAMRAAQRDSYFAIIERSEADQLLTAVQATAARMRFDAQIGEGDIRNLIRTAPELAKTMLDDPENWTFLTPSERQQFWQAADTNADAATLAGIAVTAAFQPVTATLSLNQINDPAHASEMWQQLGTISGFTATPATVAFAGDPYAYIQEHFPIANIGMMPAQFAVRLAAMIRDAERETGTRVEANSGEFSLGRTYSQQAELRARFEAGGPQAARPGSSLHETGMAADIAAGPALDWAHEHAHDYGLEFPDALASNDPGHVQMAGTVTQRSGLGNPELMLRVTRDQAERLGIAGILDLNDADLIRFLRDNPDVANDISERFFVEMTGHYGGNAVLALAAYNAGPEAADRWRDAAIAAAGTDATAEQILAVIDDDRTKAFIEQTYARFGAQTGLDLDAADQVRAADGVAGVFAAQRAAITEGIHDMAAFTRASNESIATLQTPGGNIANEDLAQELAVNRASAALGNAEAQNHVRTLEELIALKPHLDEILRMPIGEARQRLAEAEFFAAQGGITGEEQRMLDAYRGGVEEVGRALAAGDVMGPYWRGTGAPPIDINPEQLGDGTQGGALAVLGAQAERAAGFYDVAPAPFRPGFAEQLQRRYREADPPVREAMLDEIVRAMSTTSPVAAEAAIAQITEGDPVAYFAGQMMLGGRTEDARQILNGQVYLRDHGDAAATARQNILNRIGAAIYPYGAADPGVADAAVAWLAGDLGPNPDAWTGASGGDLDDAIAATFGEMGRLWETKFPAPPGMSAGTAIEAVRQLNEGALAPYGMVVAQNINEAGLTVWERLPARELAGIARLQALGPNDPRYAVMAAGGSGANGLAPVMVARPDTDELQPLVIDLNDLAAHRAGRQAARQAENILVDQRAAEAREQLNRVEGINVGVALRRQQQINDIRETWERDEMTGPEAIAAMDAIVAGQPLAPAAAATVGQPAGMPAEPEPAAAAEPAAEPGVAPSGLPAKPEDGAPAPGTPPAAIFVAPEQPPGRTPIRATATPDEAAAYLQRAPISSYDTLTRENFAAYLVVNRRSFDDGINDIARQLRLPPAVIRGRIGPAW